MSDQMTWAMMRQADAARRSGRIDRRGWSDDQWIADARRLMDELDGAVTSLLNGHILALLRAVEARPAAPAGATVTREAVAWDEGRLAAAGMARARSGESADIAADFIEETVNENPYRAALGVTVTDTPLTEGCPICQGTGGYWAEGWRRCSACAGTGRVAVTDTPTEGGAR